MIHWYSAGCILAKYGLEKTLYCFMHDIFIGQLLYRHNSTFNEILTYRVAGNLGTVQVTRKPIKNKIINFTSVNFYLTDLKLLLIST